MHAQAADHSQRHAQERRRMGGRSRPKRLTLKTVAGFRIKSGTTGGGWLDHVGHPARRWRVAQGFFASLKNDRGARARRSEP